MKTLNITKEAFEKSNYFTRKYGKLAFVSESGKLFRTNRGKVLKFAKEAGRKVINAANGCHIHDMSDCWIVTNKNGLNIGQCRTLSGAKEIAENADEYTAKKLKGMGYDESKKIVKEGAGAGYTVHIKGLKFGKIIDYKWEKGQKSWEDYCTVKVKVVPGSYEIGAESYYDDFFWDEHERDITPEAYIDGGYAIFDIGLNGNPDEDDESYMEMVRELENRELDISFMYGAGWSHADLPDEIESNDVEVEENEFYGSISKIELNAPDLADAVNCGYKSLDDRDADSEDEEFDESYEPDSDDGRKRVMDALEEFRNVLWEDTKVGDKEEHSLRKSLFQEADDKISQAVQKYFKYSRM